MIKTRITKLFDIETPVIQGGMVWNSGWRLASAVSQSGGLGLIGAGSMSIDVLRTHIRKARAATTLPVGVNVPQLYKGAQEQIECALEEGIRIVFTSAGSPKTFAPMIQSAKAIHVHVASTPELARKCEDAGCNAVVVEGTEAGGHNGRDELTTLVLVPMARAHVTIPLIAAGGIASGYAIAAALALGAEGVQVGSRFAITEESSAHINFKRAVTEAPSAATRLCMKKLVPVRLMHSKFEKLVTEAENRCASNSELEALLGKGRARKGMHEGDLEEGELEIGQVAGAIKDIKTVAQVFNDFKLEYMRAVQSLQGAGLAK